MSFYVYVQQRVSDLYSTLYNRTIQLIF